MAYARTVSATHDDAFADDAFTNSAFTNNAFTNAQTRPRGLLAKILDAIVESQQRRADAQITRYLRARGGRLTDETEREIERRFLLPRQTNLSQRRP